MKFYLLLFLLFCGSPFLSAQATLVISTVPMDVIVRVDGKVVSTSEAAQPYRVVVEAGEHLVEIWKSPYLTERKTVVVKDGERKRIVMGVKKLEPDYETYIDEKGKYDKKRILRYSFDIALVGTSLYCWYSAASINNKTKNELRDRARVFEELYYGTIIIPDQNEYAKQYYLLDKRYQEEQKKNNRNRLIRYPTAIGLSVLSYFIINKHRKKRITPPLYNPKKAFSLIVPDLSYQSIGFGISYNFE